MAEVRQQIKLRKLMNQLLAEVKPAQLKKMQTQFDELESQVTKEELNRMATLLRGVVSAENLRKVSKR
jgi:formate dehydrogenase maturation protein FdhE